MDNALLIDGRAAVDGRLKGRRKVDAGMWRWADRSGDANLSNDTVESSGSRESKVGVQETPSVAESFMPRPVWERESPTPLPRDSSSFPSPPPSFREVPVAGVGDCGP